MEAAGGRGRKEGEAARLSAQREHLKENTSLIQQARRR